jgi:POT family proton-dependent oligopeptide transporter
MGTVQEFTYKPDTFPLYDAQFRTHKDPATGEIAMGVTMPPYFQNMAEAERPAIGETIKVVSTEIYQSVNPFFVIALTPLLIWFFGQMRRRKREPTTPGKIGWGLIITALSTLVTIFGVYACHNGEMKASVGWLIGTYGVVTLGELCISPMGLSTVSKMAPPRIAGLMMGGWMLATAIGNKLSGVLATMWDGYDDKANFFWVNFVLLAVAALALMTMLKWLNKIFRDQGLT